MSKIEVPDWVVEIAARVVAKNVGEDYDSIGKFAQDTIKATQRECITAALGAWVVPVGCASRKALAAVSTPPFYGCDAYISAAEQTDVVCDRIYYLRQEKPE